RLTRRGGQTGPALRVESANAPLRVARRLLGATKLASSRLDRCVCRLNRADGFSVNRPWIMEQVRFQVRVGRAVVVAQVIRHLRAHRYFYALNGIKQQQAELS